MLIYSLTLRHIIMKTQYLKSSPAISFLPLFFPLGGITITCKLRRNISIINFSSPIIPHPSESQGAEKAEFPSKVFCCSMFVDCFNKQDPSFFFFFKFCS